MPNSTNEIKDWIKNWVEESKKSGVAVDNVKIWGKVSACFFILLISIIDNRMTSLPFINVHTTLFL